VDRRFDAVDRHGADDIEPARQMHMLARMIPLVENNYNCCELGPKGTGKSHIYKEISPNSILISGGQTTVANLFYNMVAVRSSSRLLGCGRVRRSCRDHIQGKRRHPDHEGLHGSGSFARGKDSISAYASMVFIGNISNIEALCEDKPFAGAFPEA